MFNFYLDKRNYSERDEKMYNFGGGSNYLERILRGDIPDTTPDGKSCFRCNYGTFPFCTPCENTSEAHKVLMNCSECKSYTHFVPTCVIIRCVHARIPPRPNWKHYLY